MSTTASERSYCRGKKCLAVGDALAALAYFEAALRLAGQEGKTAAPIYLSYYGLSLAYATGQIPEAARACRRALKAEFYNTELYLNLGKCRVPHVPGRLESGERQPGYPARSRTDGHATPPTLPVPVALQPGEPGPGSSQPPPVDGRDSLAITRGRAPYVKVPLPDCPVSGASGSGDLLRSSWWS